MSGPVAIISDLDGTLVDTRAANLEAYALAFADAGLPFARERYLAAFGLRFDEMAAAVAPDADDRALQVVRTAKAAHYARLVPSARVNDGVVQVLRLAAAAGLPRALATTARRTNAEAVLDGLGLAELFDVVVCGEDVVRGKPDPECYVIAAHRLAVRPEDCLVLEDSEVGVAAATAAGCRVLQVTA